MQARWPPVPGAPGLRPLRRSSAGPLQPTAPAAGRLRPPSTGRRPTPPPAASTSVHRSRQAAGGQARGRREAPPPRAEAGCGCAARAAGGRCCRRGPPEAACSGARDGRTGRWGDGRTAGTAGWGDGRRAAGRRAQRPEDEATSCGRRRRAGAGGAVASRGWLGLLAKRPPNPAQTLGCAGLKPEASRSPILGPQATKSRPSMRLPVFLSNFSVVLASGRRRRDLLPSRRRGELMSEDILYCSAKGT